MAHKDQEGKEKRPLSQCDSTINRGPLQDALVEAFQQERWHNWVLYYYSYEEILLQYLRMNEFYQLQVQ